MTWLCVSKLRLEKTGREMQLYLLVGFLLDSPSVGFPIFTFFMWESQKPSPRDWKTNPRMRCGTLKGDPIHRLISLISIVKQYKKGLQLFLLFANIFWPTTHPSTCSPIHLAIHPPCRLPVHLPVHHILHIQPSIHPVIICPLLCPLIHPFSCPFIHLSIHPPSHLSIHSSVPSLCPVLHWTTCRVLKIRGWAP